MPAEWEPHRSTWLGWPHQLSDWPGKFAPIPWVYGEIVRTLARYEPVNVLVPDEKIKARAEQVLRRAHANSTNVGLWVVSTNRSWVRDSGPIFVTDPGGNKVALDWGFNAWAKYPDWQLDDQLAGVIAGWLGVPAVRPTFAGRRVVLEGGGIDVNGRGLLLTTEEWLLSDVQQRNPGMTRADYEAVFAEYLGATKVLWLGRGIVGDDTHGHVDDITRFVNPNTVVTAIESESADANYDLLRENLDRLRGMTDTDGRKLDVVPLPMPAPLWFRGRRLPASYANFYVANGVVIVPTFNDPKDRVALGTLAELFPGRDVVGIHGVDLVWGLGTLHCMTQQEPAL
jgi:agmatine deiminase